MTISFLLFSVAISLPESGPLWMWMNLHDCTITRSQDSLMGWFQWGLFISNTVHQMHGMMMSVLWRSELFVVSSVQYVELTQQIADVTAVTTTRRREYRDLLQKKTWGILEGENWCWTLEAVATVWFHRHVHGSGRTPTSADVSFFYAKVAIVGASTSDAPPPLFTASSLGCVLSVFRPLSVIDVVTVVCALSDKQCMLDPLWTKLLMNNVIMLAPFLVKLFNQSITRVLPSIFKFATSHHCWRKPTLTLTQWCVKS